MCGQASRTNRIVFSPPTIIAQDVSLMALYVDDYGSYTYSDDLAAKDYPNAYTTEKKRVTGLFNNAEIDTESQAFVC